MLQMILGLNHTPVCSILFDAADSMLQQSVLTIALPWTCLPELNAEWTLAALFTYLCAAAAEGAPSVADSLPHLPDDLPPAAFP